MAMSEETKTTLNSWLYNVQDRFRGMSTEEIQQDLSKRHLPLAIAMEHWLGDFNAASALRNANGFNLREAFYIGKKHWNRNGAVGSHHYTKFTHFSNTADFVAHAKTSGYHLIGLDNIEGSEAMVDFEWPENTLMVFGEEGPGLTKEMQEACEKLVYIPMYGSVRSFNCATSSGIAIYDFVIKRIRNGQLCLN